MGEIGFTSNSHHFTTISHQFRINFKSISQRFHITFTSISNQFHIIFTTISHRFHNDFTTIISHRFHIELNDVALISQQFHIKFTAISHQFHMKFTSFPRAARRFFSRILRGMPIQIIPRIIRARPAVRPGTGHRAPGTGHPQNIFFASISQ